MSAAGESRNLPDHSTGRIDPDGWRVVGNPTRRPDPGADEFKTLTRTMRKGGGHPAGGRWMRGGRRERRR
jgi:hypothetical protein